MCSVTRDEPIDPSDPNSVPLKHTSLGRFAHEGVVFAPPVEGRPIVCYSGDDTMFEHIYKFVSAAPFSGARTSVLSAAGAAATVGVSVFSAFDARRILI